VSWFENNPQGRNSQAGARMRAAAIAFFEPQGIASYRVDAALRSDGAGFCFHGERGAGLCTACGRAVWVGRRAGQDRRGSAVRRT